MKHDYYNVLGVSYNAPDDIIKKEYHRLALKWHPDRRPGDKDATARFQAIQEAYETLSDPDKRELFDLSRPRQFTASSFNSFQSRESACRTSDFPNASFPSKPHYQDTPFSNTPFSGSPFSGYGYRGPFSSFTNFRRQPYNKPENVEPNLQVPQQSHDPFKCRELSLDELRHHHKVAKKAFILKKGVTTITKIKHLAEMYNTLNAILTFLKKRLLTLIEERKQAYKDGFNSSAAKEYRMLKFNAVVACIHEYQAYLDDMAIVCLNWVEMSAEDKGREDRDVVEMRKHFDKELTAWKVFLKQMERDLRDMVENEEKMRMAS